MKLIKLHELFKVEYGVNLELNKLVKTNKRVSNSVYFISRTSKNNGASAIVKIIDKISAIPANTITVAAGGSVLETYLQPLPYYSGRDLYYLTPKVNLNEKELLFYCYCIKMNKFKYSFGRQANKTLKDLLIPDITEIPKWVNSYNITELLDLDFELQTAETPLYRNNNTLIKNVPLIQIFDTVNGLSSSNVKRRKHKINKDYLPYVRPSNSQASSSVSYVNRLEIPDKYIFPKNTLYVSTDGQGSHTYSYVSTFEFVPNSNVTVLIPKRTMSLRNKLYYSMVITKNRPLFSYGRKPKGNKLKNLLIPEFPHNWIYTERLQERVFKTGN